MVIKLLNHLTRRTLSSQSILDFGKHRGKPLSQLEDGYLQWMERKCASDWWRKLAAKVLQERYQGQERGGSKDNGVLSVLANLKACSRTQNLHRGRQLHADAAEIGHSSNIYVASALINMYAKCGSMDEARQVFDRMKHPDVVCWTVLILGYADNGQSFAALDLFAKMRNGGPEPNSVTLMAALKACASLAVKGGSGWAECKVWGKEIHELATKNGCDSDIYVQSTLISMYAKCGSMDDAREVFDGMTHPNVVTWNALILGYAANGRGLTALELFARMIITGPAPDSVTFVGALKATGSLVVEGVASTLCMERALEIHKLAIKNGCDSDIYVQSTLIDMYAKLGSMVHARQVFDSMKRPNVVSWNALILGYVGNGESTTALNLFGKMESEGLPPDSVTVVAAIKACTSALDEGSDRVECIRLGKELHHLAVENGHDSDIFVKNTLIDMYARFGCMPEAREVFDSLHHPDVVSWTVLIMGYAENGEGATALEFFGRMKCRRGGPEPDSLTFVAVLKACSSLLSLGCAECSNWGKAVHNLAVESCCNLFIYVQTTLIDMYAKSGSLVEARQVFDSMKQQNLVAWNVLIMGYADTGQGLLALDLFTRMKYEGPAPEPVTFIAALKACTSLAVEGKMDAWAECRERGKEIHELAIRNGCNSDIYVQSTLIDMYAKCGSMVDARSVFDGMNDHNVVSWNVLILGYADNGQGLAALDLFARMKNGGCTPDSATFVAALKACTSLTLKGTLGWVECKAWGKEIHDCAMETGCYSNANIQNTLIDMYTKCGSMADARQVFDTMTHPDVVSWSALILGYVANGEGRTALDLFTRMKCGDSPPNSVTFSAALKACGLVGDLQLGRTIHSEIEKGNHLNVVAMSSLVDFYAKCGSLVEAQRVFDLHAEARTVITWNVLLTGFSNCGDHESVFGLFKKMQDTGFQPDPVTYTCILTCCSHSGLLERGKEFFKAMSVKHGIVPTVEHYTCMVDLFGRANKLDEAMCLLQLMHCSPNYVTWMTILAACRKWKNFEIGSLAFQSLIHFNGNVSADYVLMGQIFENSRIPN